MLGRCARTEESSLIIDLSASCLEGSLPQVTCLSLSLSLCTLLFLVRRLILFLHVCFILATRRRLIASWLLARSEPSSVGLLHVCIMFKCLSVSGRSSSLFAQGSAITDLAIEIDQKMILCEYSLLNIPLISVRDHLDFQSPLLISTE